MRVFQSPSAAERLETARRFVLDHPPATELLLLGATRDAIDDFARGIAVARRATFGLHRLTLTQLAARLAAQELARRGLAPASALGARAMAVRAAHEAGGAQELEYLKPVAGFPGFPAALAATLSELRLGAVEPAAAAGLRAPGPDLAALLSRLEEELERSGIADRAALFQLATRAVTGGGDPIVGLPVLLLDVALATRAEAAMVRALAASSPAVLATVPAGDEPTLAALGGQADEGCAGRGGLARLRRNVFALETPPPEPADDQVILFSAPGEERECLEVARKVLEEARGGVPFDRMAILLRAPETYGALLEHALARAEIPAFFARGTRRPDPAGRAFLTLLACAAGGLSAARFAEYLSLGQVPRLDEAGRQLWVAAEEEVPGSVESPDKEAAAEAPPDADEAPVLEGTLRAPWRWERLLVEAAVIGGRERWQRRLDVLESRLRLELRAARAEEPDSGRVRWLERELVNLGHLRGFSLPVVERLAGLPAAATWGEWLEALEALAPGVLRSPERVLTVLAELRSMAPVGPVTLDQVRAVLTEPLANLAEEPPPHRYGRVFIGTPEQARGREFQVVFLPGLAEGLFPHRPRQDPLLLDDLRAQLNASFLRKVPGTDLRLPVEEDRLREERLLLRLAAGAASRRLYLSYPRLDVRRARERVPSLYALEAQRAVLGRIPRLDELRAAAAAASGAWLAWPAPEDPALALDVREHDLAVLRRLLQPQEAGPARGRARYLFELNAHLARSLRARWARWHRGPWRPQDGLVGAAGALAGQGLRQRPYSVSALQRFAICPYQFYLSSVWRLEPREEPAPLERLDPLTRGQMFHRVQAQLYRRLAGEGALPVGPGTLEAATAALDGVLAGVAAEYGEELAPKVARVWQDEVEAMRADLRAWLDHVAERDEGWQPVDFEASFGLPRDDDEPPLSAEPVAVGDGYLLHGVVDLLERREEVLRVTDHKTGARVPAEGIQVAGGEVLQPVLYGLAVERATGRQVAEGRLFYCTPAAGFQERTVPLHEMARDHGLEVLAIVDQAIGEGTLPPAPKTGACGWCDFRDVCGPHEERRSQRKGRLEGLAALRGLP